MLAKILERPLVIRLFGIGFILAPLFNIFMTSHGLVGAQTGWSTSLFWHVATKSTLSYQLLHCTSVLIGILVLSHASAAWKYVLTFLGGYILVQISNLGESFQRDKSTALFFVINVFVFFFIADQLVWKQKVKTATKPRIAQAKKKIMIHLEGFGSWAQLLAVSGKGISMRSLVPQPPEIGTREIEVNLQDNLSLRLRLASQSDTDFHFEYAKPLTPHDVAQLNTWLKKSAA